MIFYKKESLSDPDHPEKIEKNGYKKRG